MLNRQRLTSIALSVAAAATLVAAATHAAPSKTMGNKANANNNNNQNNTGSTNKVQMGTGGNGNAPAAVDDSAVKTAQAAATTAHDEQRKAETSLNDLTRKFTNEFEQTTPMKAALDDVRHAQADYQSASKAATDKLASNADYAQALADKSAAEANVAKLREAAAPADEVTQASTHALAKAAAVSRLQLDAVNADPAATDARAKLGTANQHAAEARKAFTDNLPNNPEWAAAKKTADDAKDASKQADATLADARRAYAQQVQAARAK